MCNSSINRKASIDKKKKKNAKITTKQNSLSQSNKNQIQQKIVIKNFLHNNDLFDLYDFLDVWCRHRLVSICGGTKNTKVTLC
jgi:sulfur relay (sulfurtransferase) DsrF/TusC family protein